MKIKLVNDDQLQIIVTKNDMLDRDMRTLFKDIIEQARLQFGFEVVHNTSLMVEAYPLSQESMILTITKVNNEKINYFDMFMSDHVPEDPWAIFEFATLDDVITLAELAQAPDEVTSALYKYDGRFALYVEDVNSIAEEARGHFVEYGEISQLSKDFLDEHGTLFIAEKALTVLKNL